MINSNSINPIQNDTNINETSGNSTIEVKSDYKKKLSKENKIEQVIEYLFAYFSAGLRIIGPFFAFSLTVFVLLVGHTFITIVIPHWKKILGNFFGYVLYILIFYFLFTILFNYLLAVLIKPGSTSDILNSKSFGQSNIYTFSTEVQKEVQLDYLLKKNGIDGENVRSGKEKLKMCNICKDVKPIRAHHCQICGYCVLKMDHHCPWINNCIGQNNHRYFVLFLTHTLMGCIFVSIFSLPIFFSKSVAAHPTQFSFVCILCLTGGMILIFFSTWNWFLVLNGNTTIEFWSAKAGLKSDCLIKDFSLEYWKENLYMVFGSKNLLEIILVPAIKKLPYSGLEWSRFVDSKFKLKEKEEECKELCTSEGLIENELLRDIEI